MGIWARLRMLWQSPIHIAVVIDVLCKCLRALGELLQSLLPGLALPCDLALRPPRQRQETTIY